MQRYKFLIPKSNRDLPWAVACPTNHNLRDIAFIGLCTPRLLWNNNVAQGRSQSRALFMEKRVKSRWGHAIEIETLVYSPRHFSISGGAQCPLLEQMIMNRKGGNWISPLVLISLLIFWLKIQIFKKEISSLFKN